MRDCRRLALLVLVDALLTLAVVHRAQQHSDALEIRRLALGAIKVAGERHQEMR